MASRGFSTRISFAAMTKKMDGVLKVKEESRRNQEIIEKNKIDTIETNKWRIRERSEISSALKETTRITLEMKERLERRK